ncbi:MAG: RimK family alpha-L-glutamate ligase [Clostridia bacterium]|nr:RimK family alpha-L-glutamate ligase [Clostridia bacterium]
MKGLIVKNAYYHAEVYNRQCERLKEELEKLGADVTLRDNDFFPLVSDEGAEWNDLGYDFCVYLDKDRYASRILSQKTELFNRFGSIETCDDKMLTVLRLSGRGVPMPKTLPGLLCYRIEAVVPRKYAEEVGRKLGYPVIVKTAYGSQGKGVYKADNEDELLRVMNEIRLLPHLLQEFVATSKGRDLRVIVVGGEAIGCMERVGDDFRSNVGAGGHGLKRVLDDKAKEIAEKASKILGLDFCGVDLLFGEDGYKVCEVNSNAFFEEFEAVTGINVAGAYAKYIIEKMTT